MGGTISKWGARQGAKNGQGGVSECHMEPRPPHIMLQG